VRRTALFGAIALSTGCVERLLQVRSDPAGAKVYVNGDEVGVTPLDHKFTFYGTVDVALRAPGHYYHREFVSLDPPWYEVFPIDLVSELMLPWMVRDVHTVEVALVPAPPEMTDAERAALEEKAKAMRASMTPAQPSEKAQVKTPDKSQEKAAEKAPDKAAEKAPATEKPESSTAPSPTRGN